MVYAPSNFLTKNAPKFSPKVLSLHSVARKAPAKCPQDFPAKKTRKIHRRAVTSFCRRTGRIQCQNCSWQNMTKVWLSPFWHPLLTFADFGGCLRERKQAHEDQDLPLHKRITEPNFIVFGNSCCAINGKPNPWVHRTEMSWELYSVIWWRNHRTDICLN